MVFKSEIFTQLQAVRELNITPLASFDLRMQH